MSMTPSTCIALASLCLGAATSNAATALPRYDTIELQARSNLIVNDNGYNLPPGSSFNSISASINADATVAFIVGVVPDAASSHPAVWSGAHGSGELVFEAPSDSFISSDTAINAQGAIVFSLADAGAADGLHVYDPVTATADRIGTSPVIPDSYGTPGINASGAVGYQANFSGNRRAYASTAQGATLIHAADVGIDPDSPYTYLYTAAFNDLRHVAAKVATSADLSSKVEIRIFASDGSSTLILSNQASDAGSPYSKFDNSLALNNHDVIAVIATRASDNRRVVVRSDGTTTTEIAVAGTGSPLQELDFFAPAINDDGVVAFRTRDAAGQAIYAGDGTDLLRVIGNGDAVATDLGSAQLGQNNATDPVFSGKPGINARGDIAFVAGVYPEGDNQIEWGSGVFIAYASSDADDTVFADGFEVP